MTYNPQTIPLVQLFQLYDIIRAYEKLKEHNLLTDKQITGFERLKEYVGRAEQ